MWWTPSRPKVGGWAGGRITVITRKFVRSVESQDAARTFWVRICSKTARWPESRYIWEAQNLISSCLCLAMWRCLTYPHSSEEAELEDLSP